MHPLSPFFRPLAATLVAVAALGVHAATVEVRYTDPGKFTDAGRPYGQERDATLEGIRRHLELRAGRLLPEAESLQVTITDLDLAGSYEQSQRYSREVRVVRRTYPPRIDLTFRLTRGDALVKSGERSLRDTTFNEALRYKDDALGYEKQMLDDWLRREFIPTR
jgi:hypothetical protein